MKNDYQVVTNDDADYGSTSKKIFHSQKRRPTIYFYRTARRPSYQVDLPKSQIDKTERDERMEKGNGQEDIGHKIQFTDPFSKKLPSSYHIRTAQRSTSELDEPESAKYHTKINEKIEDNDDDNDLATISNKKLFEQRRVPLTNFIRTFKRSPGDLGYQNTKNCRTKEDNEMNAETETIENGTSRTKKFNPFYNPRSLQIFSLVKATDDQLMRFYPQN